MDIKERIEGDLFTAVLQIPPRLGLRAKVFLTLDCGIEEVLRFPDGVETIVRNWNSSRHRFNLDLLCNHAEHICDFLCDRIPNPSACEYLAGVISEASAGMGFGTRSFSITLHAKLTQERILILVPSDSPTRAAPESLLQRLWEERTVDEKRFKEMGLESETCSICLQDFLGSSGKNLTHMPCSHVFHSDCVFEWLRKQNSCPLCRREISDVRV
ncbi:PREDICTED: E3 ubiquitin-protein ligase ATL41-like [Tarenaya hassleriana]|uniref:E3 ubiquitin-protein ligase ATL41-like n=1 Tax=Tarenaya hassleriana TaxID=28532 RepID=UPI00053C3BC2|nr:PREDICTED: E3 ubiquitin-protein ligase ATL41-like [Tarenaya hassleriana]